MRFNGFDHHHVNVYVETDVTMKASASDLRKLQRALRVQEHRNEFVTQYQSSAAAAIGEPNFLSTIFSAHFAEQPSFFTTSPPLFLFLFLLLRLLIIPIAIPVPLQLRLILTLPSKPLAFSLFPLLFSPHSLSIYHHTKSRAFHVQELDSIKNSDAQLGQMA